MTDADELLEDEGPPKPATSKIVLILLALNLGVSGFSAFKVMTLPTAAAAEATDENAVDPDVPGPLYAFEPFVVNLNDIENPRFLKIKIDVELADEETVKLIDETKLRILRDPIMRYLSNLKMDDIMGEKAKTKIADEIIVRLAKDLGDDKVRRVLFAEFVVQ